MRLASRDHARLRVVSGDCRPAIRHVYHGAEWVAARLPQGFRPWIRPGEPFSISPGHYADQLGPEELEAYTRPKPWVWPAERVFLLSDVHADADAFVDSLVASSAVRRTGPGPKDFELTDEGRAGRILIAGDCLDKGPENLRLLDSLRHLYETDATVELLAGNHDVRALIGFLAAGRKEDDLAHLFIRMGQKVVPLLVELLERYGLDHVPTDTRSERAAHDKLFPDEAWYEKYPEIAKGIVPDRKIGQELVRIREKCWQFLEACYRLGLSLQDLDSIIGTFRRHFVEDGGDYRWFFADMKVAARYGSILFIHAGVDDGVIELLGTGGVEALNDAYRQSLRTGDLFRLYHGSIGNCFRTKYRETDQPLSATGVSRLFAEGIYAIVHGHRNLTSGQRMMLREGMLNFECDVSLDRNTRSLEGLPGRGAGATVIDPEGAVLGVSCDLSSAKLLDMRDWCDLLTTTKE